MTPTPALRYHTDMPAPRSPRHAPWPVAPLAVAAALLLTLAALATAAAAADGVTTRTVYDDDADTFVTTGRVVLDVPFATVTRVAAAYDRYRDWALVEINQKPDGGEFITMLRDVRYLAGGAGGRGAFDVTYDVDLVWPFGSEGDILRFAVKRDRHHPDGGVDQLAVELGGDSRLIEAFDLVLTARPHPKGAVVDFESRTRFVGVVDTFFPLSVYRKNIEWRIGKVIGNLKKHVEPGVGEAP